MVGNQKIWESFGENICVCVCQKSGFVWFAMMMFFFVVIGQIN